MMIIGRKMKKVIVIANWPLSCAGHAVLRTQFSYPKSRVDIFGKEFQEAKEKFSVPRDAIGPPCDKGIWVNSMENEPLASMMCQNLITVVTAIPVVWGALGRRFGKFIEETHCSILIQVTQAFCRLTSILCVGRLPHLEIELVVLFQLWVCFQLPAKLQYRCFIFFHFYLLSSPQKVKLKRARR